MAEGLEQIRKQYIYCEQHLQVQLVQSFHDIRASKQMPLYWASSFQCLIVAP